VLFDELALAAEGEEDLHEQRAEAVRAESTGARYASSVGEKPTDVGEAVVDQSTQGTHRVVRGSRS